MNTTSKVLKAPLTSLRLVREGTVEYGEPVTRAAIAYSFLRPLMADLAQEAFFVVGLDTRNHVVVVHQVAMGSPMGVAFNLGDVAKVLLLSNSTGVLCAHNHPSTPSAPTFLWIPSFAQRTTLIPAGFEPCKQEPITGLRALPVITLNFCELNSHCLLAMARRA